jgi:predicted GNAT family N-acyltransferase
MKQVTLSIVTYAKAKQAIQKIRHQVFQLEQGVDPALEFDGLDETAIHLLAQQESEPIGTTRIRFLSNQLAKIERVSVLASRRGQGIGRRLMETAIALISEKGIPEIKINAQIQVCSFYQNLGFEPWGEIFDEAGIPHIEMRRQVF